MRITQKEESFVFDPYEFCVNCLLNYHIQSQAARCGNFGEGPQHVRIT